MVTTTTPTSNTPWNTNPAPLQQTATTRTQTTYMFTTTKSTTKVLGSKNTKRTHYMCTPLHVLGPTYTTTARTNDNTTTHRPTAATHLWMKSAANTNTNYTHQPIIVKLHIRSLLGITEKHNKHGSSYLSPPECMQKASPPSDKQHAHNRTCAITYTR